MAVIRPSDIGANILFPNISAKEHFFIYQFKEVYPFLDCAYLFENVNNTYLWLRKRGECFTVLLGIYCQKKGKILGAMVSSSTMVIMDNHYSHNVCKRQ